MKVDGRVKGTNATSRGTWRKHLLKQTKEREEFRGTKGTGTRRLVGKQHCKPRTADVMLLQIYFQQLQHATACKFGNIPFREANCAILSLLFY